MLKLRLALHAAAIWIADAAPAVSRVLPGPGSERRCTGDGSDSNRADRQQPSRFRQSEQHPYCPPSWRPKTTRCSRSSRTSATASAAACTTGRNKIVFGVGNEQAKLVFVGEGPGADEDAQGIPFVGRAGQLLTQMIEGTAKKEGIPTASGKDVYICNVVKCRPPENRTPEPDEMEICGQFLFRQLSV